MLEGGGGVGREGGREGGGKEREAREGWVVTLKTQVLPAEVRSKEQPPC